MSRLGLLTAEPSPHLLDQVVAAGLSFVIVDAEWTTIGPAECAAAARQLQGSGTEAFVRVPEIDDATLVTYANTGVDEIVLPQVRTLPEIESAWRAVRFPPAGRRPRQPTRANGFGASWNNVPRLSAIIETVESVRGASELARSGLLAGAWFGATDLADDAARIGEDIDLVATGESMLTCFADEDLAFGMPVASAADAEAQFQRGVDRCFVHWDRLVPTVLAPLAAAVSTSHRPTTDAFLASSRHSGGPNQ